MIVFTGIKSGPVAFLGFLSLKPYLAIGTAQRKTKKACKALIGESKGAYKWWMKHVGVQALRRVRHVSKMGKTRRRKGAQGAQFSRLRQYILLVLDLDIQ